VSKAPAFSEAEATSICAQYSNGQSAAALARLYSVTPPTIIATLRRCGLDPRARGRPSPVFNDPVNCRAIAVRHLAGESVTSIARDFGVNPGSIWLWLNRRGLIIRRNRATGEGAPV
jgi:hypothetical protein